MGYYTRWVGELKFKPTKPLKLLLSIMIEEASKCEWISQFDGSKDTDWFYPCDVWIAYAPFWGLNLEKGKLKIDEEWKAYEEAVEKLCWLITQFDEGAEGEFSWFGEEESDTGKVVIKHGKVLILHKRYRTLGYEVYSPNFDGIQISAPDEYVRPKFDFLRLTQRLSMMSEREAMKVIAKLKLETL